MKKEYNRKIVLVIAPHLDDEVLGCGGTIMKHVQCGDMVSVCFVANRIYNHVFDEEAMAVEMGHAKTAQKILGYSQSEFLGLPDERLDGCIQDILMPLEQYVYKQKPQIVYSPFCHDNHQDHRAVAQAVQVVLRPATASFIERWLIYETLSSTEQAPGVGTLSFQPNVYIDISKFMEKKIQALMQYETELRQFPHPRSAEGIQALAMKRGTESGVPYAEAFMLAREIG